jgi:hypothetical protein
VGPSHDGGQAPVDAADGLTADLAERSGNNTNSTHELRPINGSCVP